MANVPICDWGCRTQDNDGFPPLTFQVRVVSSCTFEQVLPLPLKHPGADAEKLLIGLSTNQVLRLRQTDPSEEPVERNHLVYMARPTKLWQDLRCFLVNSP